MEDPIHQPVLLRETVSALGCRPAGCWVDCTIGAGGHAEAILRATAPDGRLIGCDRDAEILAHARRRLAPFGDRVVLRQSDHRQLASLLDDLDLRRVDGVLFDLGVSSLQFDDPSRGFSFQREGPLDMRMDRSRPGTAADLVNRLHRPEITSILARYGEEPAAGRIASPSCAAASRLRFEPPQSWPRSSPAQSESGARGGFIPPPGPSRRCASR